MVLLMALVRAAINAVHPPADQGASGVVFGPDSVRAAGVPVYLDRGTGPLVRFTTDSTGFFRAPLEPRGYRRARLLICVPGRVPTLALPVEHSLTAPRYQIYPLPAGLYLGSGLVVGGWPRRKVPRECLVGPTTQRRSEAQVRGTIVAR
jgi:hypothetical protein